jgi:phosphatidylserine/phosphatidylglycerophosphate/cardiolipin synthase-like enzyme
MAYFPNGTSAEVLEDQCYDCLHRDEKVLCPVYQVQYFFNYDQVGEGQEKLRQAINMLINEKGICAVRAAFRAMKENSWLKY